MAGWNRLRCKSEDSFLRNVQIGNVCLENGDGGMENLENLLKMHAEKRRADCSLKCGGDCLGRVDLVIPFQITSVHASIELWTNGGADPVNVKNELCNDSGARKEMF